MELGEVAAILDRTEEELRSWGLHSSLREEVGLDSLEMLEIVLILEDHAGRQLEDGLFDSIDTLSDLIGWLNVIQPS